MWTIRIYFKINILSIKDIFELKVEKEKEKFDKVWQAKRLAIRLKDGPYLRYFLFHNSAEKC